MRTSYVRSLFVMPLLTGIVSTLVGCSPADQASPSDLRPPDTLADAAMPIDMATSPDLAPAVRITPIDPASHYAILTKGATVVDSGAASISPLVLSSPSAFPVLVDNGNRVFAAAALAGQGKVLVFGHNNFMSATVATGDATKIVVNAIGWMARDANPVVGVDASLTTLKTALTAAGYQVLTVKPSQLASVQVYITTGYTAYTDPEYASVQQFIKNGGGMILGGQGWSFAGDMPSYPGNRMLADTGITITNLFDVTSGTTQVSATPPSMLLNALVGIDKLIDHVGSVAMLSATDIGLACGAAGLAAEKLPLAHKSFYDVASLFLKSASPPVITAAAPFTPASDPIGGLGVRLQYRYSQDLPAEQITAHASAADFPYAVAATAPRQTFNLTVSGTYAGRDSRYGYAGATVPAWRSTGAYAAPGDKITVTVPAAFANQGLQVQIGSHTDLLWNKTTWLRFPGIVRSYPINAAQITVASAFGGSVYITVPVGATLGAVAVTISGAVSAPHYVHNTTTMTDWQTVRNNPAPWAELESQKITLMLPSSYIRSLADPVALMNFWDTVLDADADLASISRSRARAERYLIDRDISNGYMHSGYPIMAPLGEASDLVSLTALRAGKWGYWHELGHNHQWLPWVLQGTTESSVNLWSVYVSETLLSIPRETAHPSITTAMRNKRVQDYIAGGRKYATWGADAFLPLEMYLQLQEGFGWAPYQGLFADYNALSAAQSPSADQDKVDQWTLRFAQKVNKNLGPFFTSWGLPVSAAILAQMSMLPAWTQNPMP